MNLENNIQLYRFNADSPIVFDEVRMVVDKYVNTFVPYMRARVLLPNKIVNESPQLLYMRAAENRSQLDGLTTYLSGLLVFRVQVKNASKVASKIYKDALTVIYKSGKSDVKAARGYEEKELLARTYIDNSILDQKLFWENTLSDIDDLIGLIKLKMNQFKGGLDTILKQIALLKISFQFKNLTMTSEQAAMLNSISESGLAASSEGNINLNT